MEKTNVTSGKFTSEIICGTILYGIIFGLISNFLTPDGSDWLSTALSAIISFLMTILVWIFAVKSVLKKKTTSRENISKIMKALWIYFIVIIILTTIISVFQTQTLLVNLKEQIEVMYGNDGGILKQMEVMYGTVSEFSKQMAEKELQKISTEMYISMSILIMVDVISNICMIRYTKYKLETEL